MKKQKYTEDSIRSLDWKEHIRLRPGMYIGKLGDGSSSDDGIYILVKEVLDNAIDEHTMGYGDIIDIETDRNRITVRDYGRGIPLGKLMDCTAKINTGAKYDSEVFKKSVGLNGVGIKAVNALSGHFKIEAFREGKTRSIDFSKGEVISEVKRAKATKEQDGTRLCFEPDGTVFNRLYTYRDDILERMLRYYAYLNPGLTLKFNGKLFKSKNGLLDLLNEHLSEEPLYPIIHIKGDDIEIAMTHGTQYGEEYLTFVNGQHTTQGGTHQAAFREAIVKTVREFYKKTYEAGDIRAGIIAAVSIKVEEPVFESQTKTKLGSTHMAPKGLTVRVFMSNFVKEALDNHLHRYAETSKLMNQKILQSERERKELKGLQKTAKERNKKAKTHNKKLRDCRVHFDSKDKQREQSMLFITEGDSASGSITTARDVNFQAVFSLRGKPLNSFGLTKKIVYENEEFYLLQNALNIEDDLENLRYNKVVVATDADVDGMHIRLLLITFFLQFFPDLVRRGHVYILQTPLFRVRNKKETRYCYSEKERVKAIEKLKPNPEITRFKGLGEISPGEFKGFIGDDIRIEQVLIEEGTKIKEILGFYMGKNTAERQNFIIDNLKVEADIVEKSKAS